MAGEESDSNMAEEGRFGMVRADPDAYFGGQMRTYAMWCNQKLAMAGITDTIPFDQRKMTQKFRDGTFIATMLQVHCCSTLPLFQTS